MNADKPVPPAEDVPPGAEAAPDAPPSAPAPSVGPPSSPSAGPPAGVLPPAPRPGWWDRVLTMRGVVAVALASLIVGGFGGASVTAVLAHVWGDHGRHEWHHRGGWRDHDLGPGQMGPGQGGPGNDWRSRRGGSDIPIPSPPAAPESGGANEGSTNGGPAVNGDGG